MSRWITLLILAAACGPAPQGRPGLPVWSPDAGGSATLGDGGPPVRIDGCATNNGGCPDGSLCESSTEGMTSCVCPPGSTGDGFTCKPLDICAGSDTSCDPHAQCVPVEGLPFCQCKPGYSGTGFSCQPANELAAFAIGYTHVCAIDQQGFAWCWGDDTRGALGDGNTGLNAIPGEIAVASDWVRLSAGNEYTCGIRSDGSLWCWGANDAGQLGVGSTDDAPEPQQLGAAAWSAIATGDHHTCGIQTDGSLWCWGGNPSGETGQPPGIVSQTPVRLASSATWSAVVEGSGHTCALDSTGAVWCWGQGYSATPAMVSSGPVTKLAGGGEQTCALAADGSVWCWKTNEVPGMIVSGATEVAVGLDHACAIVSGAVTCWGDDTFGQTGDFSTLGTWASIAAGGNTTCALLDSTALCWGANDMGQLAEGWPGDSSNPVAPTGSMNWQSVSAASQSVCAISVNLDLFCWGDNAQGQLPIGTTAPADAPVAVPGEWLMVSQGDTHGCGIQIDGSLLCWGGGSSIPIQVGTSSVWAQVSAGGQATCAVMKNGTLWCWGDNESGQLGQGTFDPQPSPVPVVEARKWQWVSAGRRHACGIQIDGSLWCWGDNTAGELGVFAPMGQPQSSPVQALSGMWSYAVAADDATCAIRSDGSLWCWGNGAPFANNGAAMPVAPQQISPYLDWNVVSLSAANLCGVSTNGVLRCMGANDGGQLGPGAPPGGFWDSVTTGILPSAQTVSVGDTFACATQPGAYLECWGNNHWGQLGDGLAWRPTPGPVTGFPIIVMGASP